MASTASLRANLRSLCRDTTNSNRSVSESPKGLNDATNTKFRLQNPIIVPGSVYYSSGATARTNTGIVVDDANLGLITITPAPERGTQNAPFVADYYYLWFTDADYTEFLNNASRDAIGSSNPTTVVDGLISALMQYALAHFYQARATQYANRYSSSGGNAGQSVDKVTEAFQNLSNEAFKRAKDMRDDYYKGLGQREKAASTIINYAIDPMTPPR